jgi:hypothetical protein
VRGSRLVIQDAPTEGLASEVAPLLATYDARDHSESCGEEPTLTSQLMHIYRHGILTRPPLPGPEQ